MRLFTGFYHRLCCCLVAKLGLTLCDPMDCSLPGSSVHGISQAEYWSGLPFPFPGDLPNPAIESVPSALPGGFFTAEPPEKPTGDCREREGGNKII